MWKLCVISEDERHAGLAHRRGRALQRLQQLLEARFWLRNG